MNALFVRAGVEELRTAGQQPWSRRHAGNLFRDSNAARIGRCGHNPLLVRCEGSKGPRGADEIMSKAILLFGSVFVCYAPKAGVITFWVRPRTIGRWYRRYFGIRDETSKGAQADAMCTNLITERFVRNLTAPAWGSAVALPRNHLPPIATWPVAWLPWARLPRYPLRAGDMELLEQFTPDRRGRDPAATDPEADTSSLNRLPSARSSTDPAGPKGRASATGTARSSRRSCRKVSPPGSFRCPNHQPLRAWPVGAGGSRAPASDVSGLCLTRPDQPRHVRGA